MTHLPAGATRYNPETGEIWFHSEDRAAEYAYMIGAAVRKSGFREWLVTPVRKS